MLAAFLLSKGRGTVFFFIFSPNNAGKTVMSQYLAACLGGRAYLPPYGYGEGQMMPEVREMMRAAPWDAGAHMDWGHIRQVWQAALSASGKQVFIEASPPNMMRVAAIREHFAGDMKAVISTSAPLRQVASCLRNYGTAPLTPERTGKVTRRIIRRARIQAQNIASFPDIPAITYEAFCRDPALLARAFGLTPPRGMPKITGKKNSLISGIKDMTVADCAFLTEEEYKQVHKLLAKEQGLWSALGVTVESWDDFYRTHGDGPDFALGRQRRADWDAA